MTGVSRPREVSQSHTSPAPFHRASHSLDRSIDHILSSRPNYGVWPRGEVGKTRTLKGAFEAVYIGPYATMVDSRKGQASSVPQTPSPSGTKPQLDLSLLSPASGLSIPPVELDETYKQIDESENLASSVGHDDYDRPPSLNLSDRNISRRLSPTPSTARNGSPNLEQQTVGSDNSTEERISIGSNDSRRKRYSKPALDEQRLKRATASTSPAFGKGNIRQPESLSVDNLRQLDQEQRSEEDREPPPNIPRTWGSRARTHRDWLNNITRQNGYTPRGQESRPVERDVNVNIGITRHTLHRPHRSPVRSTLDRSRRESVASWPRNEGPSHVEFSEGHAIPNSPVVIYRAASLEEKPRSDSRELLRKLSRTESPNQTDTTEPPAKQIPVSRMLDKTPIVTGAWIDTPITERAAESTEDISKEIESPSKSKSKPRSLVNTRSPIIVDVKDETEQVVESILKESAVEGKKAESASQEKKVSVQKRIRPDLPRSALEAVLRQMKSNDDSLLVGDDTIASLEELIRDESPTTDLGITPEELPRSTEKIETSDDNTTTDDNNTMDLMPDDNSEIAIMDRLGSKLQSATFKIRDTKKEIGGLEKRILGKFLKPITATTAPEMITKTTGQETDIHIVEFQEKFYLAVPIPQLWRRNSVSGRFETTRLSTFLGLLFLWFILENIMCDYYAHPTVAMTCDRNCLMPDAPEFPFVLPTMLWRWSHLGTILSPLFTILIACYRLIAQIFGIWDGYIDDVPISVTPPGNSLQSSSWPWPFGGRSGVLINHNLAVPVAKVSHSPNTQRPPSDMNPQSQYRPNEHQHHSTQSSAEGDDSGLSMDEDEVL